MEKIPVRRALVSVYDKTGLPELARRLHSAGVEIVSTGSTAKVIADAGVPVTPVGQVTDFPECLDGRVKTLHPGIHGGLLADLRKDDHRRQLRELGIDPFELVVVNLYPFTDTVASGADSDECIEQIDIGGPAMVRASAKNFANVAVVVSPDRYEAAIESIEQGGFAGPQRAQLAAEAFAHTASYDIAVATWMAAEVVETTHHQDRDFPDWLGASWSRREVLRYGENPHQSAAVYVSHTREPGIASAEQLHGKQMSYNNYVDADAARRAAFDFVDPAVVIIKHANPCGIAIGIDSEEAYRKALSTDPVSAFGGVVAVNRPVSRELTEAMDEVFTEVIVAPDYDDDALEFLQRKKNVRILRVAGPHPGRREEGRTLSGGMLVQSIDDVGAPGDDADSWRLVAGDPVDHATLRDLQFAWTACRSVKSNAILLADSGAAVGIGMGQVNRVDSARLAVDRAGDRAAGSVAASDAFFPFPDGLQVLLDSGIRAVVHPGGSVRDDEVIAAAQAAGATMYVTGTRHFFH
jgi:phosphoribosylaminoimidazolecarboxamide formyltransferase/IMP cyclohydrolase